MAAPAVRGSARKPESPLQLESRQLERARNGDPGAIEWLYRRYALRLHEVAVRLTASVVDAEDVVHDVFAGLPQALGGLRDEDRLDPWLRKLTVNRSLMTLRARRIRSEEPIIEDLPHSHDLEAATLERLTGFRALARLPEHLRVVLILKELEGYTHAEIGESLGITAASSMMRLARARRQLQALIPEAP